MMILLLAVLAVVTLYGIKLRRSDMPEGMSLQQTNAVKGLFSLIILLSHLKQYVELTGFGNGLYDQILHYIGQLMVAPFLFYSGYGILFGLEHKKNYGKGFFVARVGRTWFKFAVALVLFVITNLCLGIHYPAGRIALSFVGWDSIGNSNWFVFDILLLYVGVQLSLWITAFCKWKNDRTKLLVHTALLTAWTLILIVVLRFFKESWWYDTLLSFPCGAVFYLIKPKLDKWWKNNWVYWLTGLGLAAVFAVTYLMGGALLYNICAACFCLLIAWFTFRVKLGNKVLDWCGAHSFQIYIYMRVPMLVLSELSMNQRPLLYAVACIAVTALLAFVMKKATGFLEGLLFKRAI